MTVAGVCEGDSVKCQDSAYCVGVTEGLKLGGKQRGEVEREGVQSTLLYLLNFPGHCISPPRLDDRSLLLADKFSLGLSSVIKIMRGTDSPHINILTGTDPFMIHDG